MSLTAWSLAFIAAVFATLLFQFQFSSSATAADLEWSFSEGNDAANCGRLTARLGYSVPETDNAQVDGVCDARSASASLILGADIGKLEEGKEITVRFSGGGFEHSVPGIVFGTKIEEGITGVSLDVDVKDKLWEVLTSKDVLDYQVPGYSSAKLPLKDGHSKIRQFIRACRDYAQGSNASAQAAPEPKQEEAKKPEPEKAATAGVSEKDAFTAAKDLGTLEAWEAFLENYSTGFRAQLARAYVKRLGGSAGMKASPSADSAASAQAPAATATPAAPADISLAVTSQGACTGGQPCSVNITATNGGGEAFTGELVLATSVAPGGASVSSASPQPWFCQDMGGGAVCTHPSVNLAPGQSTSVLIALNLPRNIGGQITSCTSISWGGAPTASDARSVQQALNDAGFNAGPADGRPGGKTKAAIRAYQEQFGLQVTGEIDLPLLLALFTQPGAGDNDPINDQACAGSAVSSAIPLPPPVPAGPACPLGQVVNASGKCGCPSSAPFWTGQSCLPRVRSNCRGGTYFNKSQGLCLCPSRKPFWYANRCNAQPPRRPGARPGGRPVIAGCPRNTIQIGNMCLNLNTAPVFANRNRGGGQSAGRGGRGNRGGNQAIQSGRGGQQATGSGRGQGRGQGGQTGSGGSRQQTGTQQQKAGTCPLNQLMPIINWCTCPANTETRTEYAGTATTGFRCVALGTPPPKGQGIKQYRTACKPPSFSISNGNDCGCPAGLVKTTLAATKTGTLLTINHTCVPGPNKKSSAQKAQSSSGAKKCINNLVKLPNGRCVCPANLPRLLGNKCVAGLPNLLQQQGKKPASQADCSGKTVFHRGQCRTYVQGGCKPGTGRITGDAEGCLPVPGGAGQQQPAQQQIKCGPGQVPQNGKCMVNQQKCTQGFRNVGGRCVPIPPAPPPVKCLPGQVLQNGKCVVNQQKCTQGFRNVGGRCQPIPPKVQKAGCPGGMIRQPNGQCVCPGGMSLQNGQCRRVQAPTLKTIKCAPNQRFNGKQCEWILPKPPKPVNCGPNQIKQGNRCVNKPPVQQQKQQVPVQCPQGTQRVGNACVRRVPPPPPVKIQKPKAPPPQQNQQQLKKAPCPAGQVRSGVTCVQQTTPQQRQGAQKKALQLRQQLQQQQQQQGPCKPGFRPGPNGQCVQQIFSDVRLKRDIELIATRDDGLKLYSFRYLWDDTAYVGVMAQDLLANPARTDAVIRHESGYYMVDYASLGLEMVALKDWRGRAER